MATTTGRNRPTKSSPDTRSQSKDGDRETMANLKQFVKEMQKSRGRTVEMRLAIMASLAIALWLLIFSDKLVNSTATVHAVFYFLCFIILAVLLSTWLDYFPSRLESIKMRPAGGQGLPLACLLPPMVCTALLCCIVDNSPQYLDLVTLYLVLLCTVSVITLIPTLVYSAPFPNSIVLYNSLLLVVVFIVNHILETPYFPLLFHTITYSSIASLLLYLFPESFTLCEASLLSNGVSLLLTDSALILAHKMEWYELLPSLAVERSQPFLFLEFGVSSFVLCVIFFSYFLYKRAMTDDEDHFYIHVWSLGFQQLSVLFGLFLLNPTLQMFIGQSPVVWLVKFIITSRTRMLLIVYWMVLVGVAGVIVLAQSTSCCNVFKSDNPSSLWMRKWFHLLALGVYVPGIAFDPPLLKMASVLVTIAFIIIELFRLFRVWPFGSIFHRWLIPFTDSRDSGDLILTHAYLLLGFSLPVWLFPLQATGSVSKLCMYAGVLSLGVGDSIAAVSGTLIGRHKWPGSNKTFEGSFMSIVCQMIVIVVIVICDNSLPLLSKKVWGVLMGSVISGAVMEAYTHQIDNLILGPFQFAICIALL